MYALLNHINYNTDIQNSEKLSYVKESINVHLKFTKPLKSFTPNGISKFTIFENPSNASIGFKSNSRVAILDLTSRSIKLDLNSVTEIYNSNGFEIVDFVLNHFNTILKDVMQLSNDLPNPIANNIHDLDKSIDKDIPIQISVSIPNNSVFITVGFNSNDTTLIVGYHLKNSKWVIDKKQGLISF